VRDVHLVGSVPLSSSDEVFRASAKSLGEQLKRFPDGETGERKEWVQWQTHSLINHPQFELNQNKPMVIQHGVAPADRVFYKLKPGIEAKHVVFEPLGYAENAKASYAEFTALRAAGVIPAKARFMVAIPSPLAFLFVLIAGEDRARVEPAYMQRLLQEVDDIAAAIPHDDLAIQWDCVFEMLIQAGARASLLDDSPEALVARMVQIGARVPGAAQLGYHFCYGDMGHRHSVEPVDMAIMVDTANRLSAGLRRRLDFVHVPVPRSRDDDAYFAPLAGLRLKPATELYLGLVHYTDGIDGTRRRMGTAQRHMESFGIGTECGFGRREPETIRPLLELHAACASSDA
jgi:hypothetical protein